MLKSVSLSLCRSCVTLTTVNKLSGKSGTGGATRGCCDSVVCPVVKTVKGSDLRCCHWVAARYRDAEVDG